MTSRPLSIKLGRRSPSCLDPFLDWCIDQGLYLTWKTLPFGGRNTEGNYLARDIVTELETPQRDDVDILGVYNNINNEAGVPIEFAQKKA
jgi:hypothetical protein